MSIAITHDVQDPVDIPLADVILASSRQVNLLAVGQAHTELASGSVTELRCLLLDHQRYYGYSIAILVWLGA